MASVARRGYVGLAFKKPYLAPEGEKRVQGVVTLRPKELEHQSVTTVENAGEIASYTSDVTKAAKWLSEPEEPQYHMVAGGLGGSCQVKIPNNASLISTQSAILGKSSNIDIKLTSSRGLLSWIRNLFSREPTGTCQITCSGSGGDVLISPQRLADIALIEMNGKSIYTIKRKAHLAHDSRVTVSKMIKAIGGSASGLMLTNEASGSGKVLISHYGGIYRLILSEGEEYLVDGRHLLAWDNRLAPKTVLTPNDEPIPSTSSVLRKYKPVDAFFNHALVQLSLRTSRQWITQGTHRLLKGPMLLKLHGPGDVFLSSRLEPIFHDTTRQAIENHASLTTN